MALSDAAVSKQIEHMIAFINNESQEKVEEIYAKADEEFQIEKGRLVNQQRVKIIDFFLKKEKTLDQQKKLQQSKFINAGRLEVLKSRQGHIKSVAEEATAELFKISKNPKVYEDMLQKLIIQAAFQLLEPKVLLICREIDTQTIEGMLEDVKSTYKAATQSELSIQIHPKKSLPNDSAGGIELSNPTGSISISNTLEARLALITRQQMPVIREQLFGSNPNRTHKD